MSASDRFTIRRAEPQDYAAMFEIERRAAELFRTVGYDFCVDAPLTDAEEVEAALARGGAAFVAAAPEGGLAGFAMTVPLDGEAHFDEVDVDPAYQRLGLARRFVETAEDWARAAGFRAMTLTTYRDVPWNAPFYARLGYAPFEPGGDRPELLALIAHEAAEGFAARPRVAMRKRI